MADVKAVWKFPINLGAQVLMMPAGAETLSVGAQGDELYLWARVATEGALEERRVAVAATGGDLFQYSAARFVGTIHQPPFVWHVFEALA